MNQKNQRRLPTQFMLLAKCLIGGYLVNIAWKLFQEIQGGRESQPFLMGFFLVLFAIAGAIICLQSLRDLIQGRYYGGKLDIRPEEETEEVEESEETEEAEESEEI